MDFEFYSNLMTFWLIVNIVNWGTSYETCRDNNDGTIYVERAKTVHNSLF